MPRTAATVGIRLYFSAIAVCWNLATTPSTTDQWPACTAGVTDDRLAPSENGSLVCHSTSAAQSRSARSTAASMPSRTSSPMVFCLLLNDTMPMSSPRCHIRTAGVSMIVVPVGQRSPSTGSGKCCRA